jgi:hypothetical protein
MEYILTCISHNRQENVKQFFEKVGTSEVVFFVKDEKDKQEYINNGAKKVIVSGSLMDSRNASLDYCFSLNKICVQLSDDLEKIMVNNFTGKRTYDYVNVVDVLENIIPDFISNKCYFAGFPPTNNPFFSLKEKEYNKFIVGDFILVKPNHLKFDNNLKLKEDYDYTLQHINKLNGTIRYGNYLNSFKHYSNKGGAVDYRTNILEQETINYLKKKWGDCIKLNSKRKNEILLNKKSFEILKSKQIGLF